MINIKTFVFNPFQENTYVLSDETRECAIVDPGCNSEKEFNVLFAYISSNKFKPVRLLLTHGHIDHVLGLSVVSENFQLKPEIHKLDLYLTNDFVSQGKIFGFNARPILNISVFLEEDIPVLFGNSQLGVLHVPGHTPGSFTCTWFGCVLLFHDLGQGARAGVVAAVADHDQHFLIPAARLQFH